MSDAPILPPNDKDDELLDALVRRACGGEVDPQAIERLSRTWRREMAGRQPLRLWMPLAAAAGLGGLAVTLALLTLVPRNIADRAPEPTPPGNAVDHPAGAVPNQTAADGSPALPRAANGEAPPQRPNEPTAYERLIARAALQRKTARTDSNLLALRRRLVERLTSLAEIDDATAVALAADLGISPNDLEGELARLSLALRGPRREKAIALFGRVATSRESLPALLQLWNQAVYQVHVAPAIARLADAEVLAACYVHAASSHVRSAVADALVLRLGEGDGRRLVEWITRSPQPDELLAAVRRIDGPLFAALFAELDAESRSVRYAAARALGALNEVQITRRLVEYVEAGHRRQEALLALAASREPAAVEFVARAKGNPVLATALQSAVVQSSTLQPWYGG